MVGEDVLQDTLRDGGGTLAASQSGSDHGGRNRHLHGIETLDDGFGGRVIDVARTAHHHETNRAGDIAPAEPGADLGKCVGADYEKKFVLGGEGSA